MWKKWFSIKADGNSVRFSLLPLKYNQRHNQIRQFWYAYGTEIEEDKEELTEVEDMSINVSDRSGDEDASRVACIII